jgi:hypothetical protein
MTTTAIRKQLHNYIDEGDDSKIKAIYALVKDDINTKKETADHWNDPTFVSEIERRLKDIDAGTATGKSWNEVHATARQKLKK